MGFCFSKEDIIETEMSTAEFFSAVYGTTPGHISLNSISDEGLLDIERWLTLPKETTFAVRYSELRENEDLYFSTCKFSEERRSKEDPFATSWIVWADADTCEPSNFRVPPSIVVQTSPGRWHVLWVLTEEVSAAQAEEASQRISIAHKDQGCDRGFTRTKLLRVPNTTNTKGGRNSAVTATDSGVRYPLAQITDAYADIDTEFRAENLGEVPTPVSADDLMDLELLLDSAHLGDLYTRKPGPGQSWSERAFKLQLECFRLGMTPQQVFSVARVAACNKYSPAAAGELTETGVPIPKRRDPDSVVWAEVQKAYSQFLQEEETANSGEDVSHVGSAESFLTIEERKFVEDNPCWVDNYARWAMTRSPDGVPDYHRSLGYLILSMSLADRVFVPLSYGLSYPNLWTTIAGLSTLDRKTTAMNFATKVIHHIENFSGETIDIGSDTTAEALVQILGKRDREASLLATDEVYGFFYELYNKNYRAGTIETFTKIYGGDVPVVLRTTKDSGNKTRARTAFGFLGVGVKSRIAQVLRRDSFEGGFLLRMTWTVSDDRRYKRGDSDIALRTEDADGGYDSDVIELAQQVWERRERYSRNDPKAFALTQEALDRLNLFAHDLHVAASSAQDQVLDSGMDRLRDSVLKCAVLLAAYDDLPEVDLACVLKAIQQGEVWYKGLVEMLNAVSTSAFGHVQDTVLGFIVAAKDHEVAESAIYSKFKFKPSEFNEVILALQKSGKIRRMEGSRWRALI